MLRTTITALLFAFTAACSGAEPGPDDAAGQGPCAGESCPTLDTLTELTQQTTKVTVPDIKFRTTSADLGASVAPVGQGVVDGQHLEENEMSGRPASSDGGEANSEMP